MLCHAATASANNTRGIAGPKVGVEGIVDLVRQLLLWLDSVSETPSRRSS